MAKTSKREWWRLPRGPLVEAVRHVSEELGIPAGSDKYWKTTACQKVKDFIGPGPWDGIGLIDGDFSVQNQIENARKAGDFREITKRHGSPKYPQSDPEYQAYLKTPHWQKVKQAALELYGYTCAICGQPGTQDDPLDVHHRRYNKYNEQPLDVLPIHRKFHKTSVYNHWKRKNTDGKDRAVLDAEQNNREEENGLFDGINGES